MVKVLCLDSYSGIGGGQKVMYEIILGLKEEMVFLVASPSGAYSKKYKDLGLGFIELSGRWPILTVRRIIRNESPDVLHMHGTRAAFWGRIALIGLGKRPKTVYTLHGFHIIRRKGITKTILVLLERFLNHWTDVLVCVSDSDKNNVLENKTIDSSKIKVINNGIDVAAYRMDSQTVSSARKTLELGDSLVISTMGRLDHPKDYSTVLKAAKALKEKGIRLKLLVVGDGPLRESLEKEMRKLSLENEALFLGFRDDVPLLMNVSDVVVLSSRWEGLPGVCLEAGAAHKPIVASDVDGVRDIVVDGKTGLFFSFGSAEDLAAKLERLALSPVLRLELGNAGYENVSANYGLDKMINGYRDIYAKATK